MGIFDMLKKGLESISTLAKMDDFLIAEIDKIISNEWKKISERKPVSIAGISLEEEAEYNFTYESPKGLVNVEMEHEFPYVEVEMKIGGRKIERKLKVSDFVEKEGAKLKLKNKETLEMIIKDMMKSI